MSVLCLLSIDVCSNSYIVTSIGSLAVLLSLYLFSRFGARLHHRVNVLSTGGGGKLLPQTPKLPPQNLVTDHGILEILGLNRIKGDHDLKTSIS